MNVSLSIYLFMMLALGFLVGFLSTILILRWALEKPSLKTLSWLFNDVVDIYKVTSIDHEGLAFKVKKDEQI